MELVFCILKIMLHWGNLWVIENKQISKIISNYAITHLCCIFQIFFFFSRVTILRVSVGYQPAPWSAKPEKTHRNETGISRKNEELFFGLKSHPASAILFLVFHPKILCNIYNFFFLFFFNPKQEENYHESIHRIPRRKKLFVIFERTEDCWEFLILKWYHVSVVHLWNSALCNYGSTSV